MIIINSTPPKKPDELNTANGSLLIRGELMDIKKYEGGRAMPG